MHKDVLVGGIDSETGDSPICVVDRIVGGKSSDDSLLSLRVFSLSRGFVVVTNNGIQHMQDLVSAVRLFRLGKRRNISSGGEGRVWAIGENQIVVKCQFRDANDKSPEDRLITMEALRQVVRQTPGLEHVRVPIQYGFITDEIGQRTWSGMQYAPGVKFSILEYEPERLQTSGIPLSELKADLDTISGLITTSFDNSVVSASHNIYPDDLRDKNVPDDMQKYRNFLIDLDTPSSTKPYTIWVIDQ